MKYTLCLLAAMVGAVCGAELGAKIMGVTTIGDHCSAGDEEVFYEECVWDVAVSMDFEGRRLELSGNRELQTGSTCTTCCDEIPADEPCLDNGCAACYPQGHWCYTYCQTSRRLTVADEHVRTERFLYEKGQIEQAGIGCLHSKIQEGHKCLGNPDDLTIEIFISE
jgi:hypothetical protein